MTGCQQITKRCALGFKERLKNVPTIFLKTSFLIQVDVKTGTKLFYFLLYMLGKQKTQEGPETK